MALVAASMSGTVFAEQILTIKMQSILKIFPQMARLLLNSDRFSSR